MQFKNVSKRFRGVIVVLSLGVLFSAGVTFAALSTTTTIQNGIQNSVISLLSAWPTTTWHDPVTWIKDGSVISAKNIADNFNYLYAKATGQVDFNNPTFIEASDMGYRAHGSSWGYPATAPRTKTISGPKFCTLVANLSDAVVSRYVGSGGCDLVQSGTTWTIKAFANKRITTVCRAACYY